MTDHPNSAVRAKGLSKKYKLEWTRRSLIALEPLDLNIQEGSVFGLLGPNGSGKSTTMKLLLGLIKPTEGEAHIFGYPAGSMAARKTIGFLPENPYFPHYLTGAEFLNYCGRLCGLSGSDLKKKIDQLLERVSMTEAGHRRLKTYSKGMLQRIGLAQALIHDPKLLILDEPTSGVDPQGSRFIRDLMIDLKSEGRTIIFSSHLLEQVEAVSDEVVILDRGRKLEEGPLSDLLTLPGKIEIEAAGSEAVPLEEIQKVLEKEGMKDVVVRHPRISLEEYFIRKVKNEKKAKKG
ncbi:MAG: ABC transporter ATP-binding protein [Verrucomicrobiota bacterium]